jgi:hypothetical protein
MIGDAYRLNVVVLLHSARAELSSSLFSAPRAGLDLGRGGRKRRAAARPGPGFLPLAEHRWLRRCAFE